MTSPYLSDDCIYYILKYFKNYRYRSTLFNCLLVNRFWCRAAVPLLYANPFDNATNKNHSSIILTLILCFNKSEILQFRNQLELIDINNVNIDNIDDRYKPLFKYPKYLENFNHNEINFTISQWFNFSSALLWDQHDKITPIFYRSILRQCDNIKHLNIPLLYNENYNIQTFTSDLTKLNSLTLHLPNVYVTNDGLIVQEFLSNIANICLNLRKLEIASTTFHISPNNTVKEKFHTIIQKQNNLKIIKLSIYCQSFLNDIFLSLEFQKYSLAFIEFKDINFNNINFNDFINLCNLKYLKFDNCKKISLDKCEILKFASFKLKELMFKCNIWNDDSITPLMIKYLGASLNVLTLIEPLKVPIIEHISTYCSSLIILEIDFNSSIDSSTFPYFKILKIRTLNLLNVYDIYSITNDIFINLANNLPISVKEVSIWFRYLFYSYYYTLCFEKFLENCHDCLEVINLNDPFNHIKEFPLIILNYIERNNNNSLKFLGMTKLEKALNDKELNLLDQIKAKGVKIVDFYKEGDSFSFIGF